MYKAVVALFNAGSRGKVTTSYINVWHRLPQGLSKEVTV